MPERSPRAPAHRLSAAVPAGRWLAWAGFLLVLVVAACLDGPAASWAAGLSSDVRHFASMVTALGTSGYMMGCSAAVALGAWWLGRRTRLPQLRDRLRRLADGAAFVLAAVAVSGVLVQVIKHVVGRARPRFAEMGAFSFHPFSIANADASFPSGHSTSAFAAAAALGVVLPRVRLAMFAVATAIGASRVLVGAHYPSDVVSGAALGIWVTLALTDAPAAGVLLGRLRGGWSGAQPARLGRAGVLFIGSFLLAHRRWSLPALASACFAIAVPPADLFGSETAEHVKDGCALLIALAGLSVRVLVAGSDRTRSSRQNPPALWTTGPYAIIRNPLDAGTILVFLGVFLMHGNHWTVLFGSATIIGAHVAMVAAEEARLLAEHGAAYADYRRRVPRWLPDWQRLVRTLRVMPFDRRHALDREVPAIGTTIVALALAEFYEEIEEPIANGQALELALLGALIVCVAVATATVWLMRRSRPNVGLG